MTDATDLWDAFKDRYSTADQVSLTNIDNRTATTVDDTAGAQAAQSVINLWPAYAEVEYDSTDTLHVEVGTFGVAALLWRRGGTATNIEEVKFEQVFGPGGMIEKVRRTGPRGRVSPSSTSRIRTSRDNDGAVVEPYGWSDVRSLPRTYDRNRDVNLE